MGLAPFLFDGLHPSLTDYALSGLHQEQLPVACL